MYSKNLTLLLSFIVILFHLAFSLVLTNVAMGLLLLSVLVDKEIVLKLKSLFSSKSFWILILPFLMFAISAFYSEDVSSGWKAIEIRLPLLIFPLVYGISPLYTSQKEKLLKFFVLLVCVIPVIGLISKIGVYIDTKDSGYFYNDHLVHFVNKQAAYFAFYANIALVIVFYFWFKKENKVAFAIITLALTTLLLLVIQYLLASRTGMMVTVLLLLGFLLLLVKKNSSKKQVAFLVVSSVVVVAGLVVLFPKAIKRFESITHTEYQFDNTNPINHFNGEIKAENWNGLNTRLALWNCAWDVIKKNPIVGTGIGDVQGDLVNNYKEKNFIFAIQSNYNCHNQYLDVILSNGFVGIILFLLFIFYIVVYSIINKNWIMFGVIFVILLSFLTENILNRNQGVVVLAIFISIMTIHNLNNQRNNI